MLNNAKRRLRECPNKSLRLGSQTWDVSVVINRMSPKSCKISDLDVDLMFVSNGFQGKI